MNGKNIIKSLENPNTAYGSFFNIFFKTHDIFPQVRIEIRAETTQNLWITKDITKSSKKKQKLYERFLKKRTPLNERKYKNYKNLFKTIKNSKENMLFQLSF